MCRVKVTGLHTVQPGVPKRLQHTHETVEWCAQLMAHIGQEQTFAAVGLLGARARLAKLPGQGLQREALFFLCPILLEEQARQQKQKQQQCEGQGNDFVLLAQRLVGLPGQLL